MKALWVGGVGILVLCLATASEGGAKGDKGYKDKIVGVWELTKGSGPPGSTVEFTKDGKLRMVVPAKDKNVEMAGIYAVVEDKINFTVKLGDKEHKETIKIKILDDKQLITEDEKGKVDEFRRKQAK